MDSTKISKHLIIALGNKAFLSLPKKGSLTEGHCLIVPIPHSAACTMVDEEVWDEINVITDFCEYTSNCFPEFP